MSQYRKIAIIIFIICLFVSGSVITQLIVDKSKFSREESKIDNFITRVNRDTTIGNIIANKYCSYSHRTYGRGDLGCSIEYTFTSKMVSEDIIIKNNMNFLEWGAGVDNLQALSKNSEGMPIKSEIYADNGLGCQYILRSKDKTTHYYIGCSGSAKHEWFPVRKN